MKKIIFFSLLSFPFLSNAQDNKPEANSFGIQYGISYTGTLAQSLIFSGWLNRGIEVRGGMLLSFTQTDNKSGDTTTVVTPAGNNLSVYSTTESKSGSITITPNISVLKHFSTKSNIDPFVGGLLSAAINMQTIQSQNIDETTGDSYDRYSNILTKNPMVYTVGVSLVGGVNYFFARNFAIGIDAGFGFTTAITNAKRITTTIYANSGSNNNSSLNETTVGATNSNVLTYNLNLSGNGGLRFTYYIKTKTKHTTTTP